MLFVPGWLYQSLKSLALASTASKTAIAAQNCFIIKLFIISRIFEPAWGHRNQHRPSGKTNPKYLTHFFTRTGGNFCKSLIEHPKLYHFFTVSLPKTLCYAGASARELTPSPKHHSRLRFPHWHERRPHCSKIPTRRRKSAPRLRVSRQQQGSFGQQPDNHAQLHGSTIRSHKIGWRRQPT
jgi:hypothetical protein